MEFSLVLAAWSGLLQLAEGVEREPAAAME
jgi:hypothetical protein